MSDSPCLSDAVLRAAASSVVFRISYSCKFQTDTLHTCFNRPRVSAHSVATMGGGNSTTSSGGSSGGAENGAHAHGGTEGGWGVQHFYLSDEWEQWSLHNHATKMTDKCVWASHKAPLKQFIFAFDGDAEYLSSKIKVKSAQQVWGYQMGLTQSQPASGGNCQILHFGRLSSSRLRLTQKYGAALAARFLETDPERLRCGCSDCRAVVEAAAASAHGAAAAAAAAAAGEPQADVGGAA